LFADCRRPGDIDYPRQTFNAVRYQSAPMYLADPKLAIFEVAFLLGYSEPI
jgi:hypothetical protein